MQACIVVEKNSQYKLLTYNYSKRILTNVINDNEYQKRKQVDYDAVNDG